MVANVVDKQRETVLPFLKWAGGKRWLTTKIDNYIPEEFDRYVEPFLGSGAIFFHISPQNAILSDLNSDLVITYKVIKNNWKSVLKILHDHHKNHCYDYYYKQREFEPKNVIERAARFIYLNRTCWNGLYRVNMSGKFNVPIGTKNNVVLDTDNFETISKRLRNAELNHCDFEDTLFDCQKGDLVFIDPPYTVKHNNNGFVQYNEKIFSWRDQERLSSCAIAASKRGARVIISNANHPSIRALYKNGTVHELNRRSTISGDKSFRGSCSELLITL